MGKYVMHLYCAGRGSPTVVLDPGLGGGHAAWRTVQTYLAVTTRACTFDRLTTKLYPALPVHTTRTIVLHLHALLHLAGEPPPYVMVGQSIGGWDVQLFANYFPRETAGMVLSDAAAPATFSRLRTLITPSLRPLVDPLVLGAPGRTERLDIVRSAKQVAGVQSVGRIPLIVISHGVYSFSWSGKIPATAAQRGTFERIWGELQDSLAHLSPDSIHVVAVHSGHDIPRTNPWLLTTAISDVVDAVRYTPHRLPRCGSQLEGLGARCVSSPAHGS